MAKENKLSGESCSWKKKGDKLFDDEILVKIKNDSQIAYLLQSYLSPLAS